MLAAAATQDKLHQTGGALGWGPHLADKSIETRLADTMNGRAALKLLVDRHALARLGLTPRTAVPRPYGDVYGNRGDALLNGGQLTLLVHPEAILVTSVETAAVHRAQLRPAESESLTPLESQVLWWIRPRALSHQGRRGG